MKRDRHVPHLCPTCDGPLTAADYCTRCSKEIAADELPVAERAPAGNPESEGTKEPVVERLISKLPGRLGERVRDRYGSDS